METTFTKEYNGHKIACALADAGAKNIVIFCHGFRSSSIGPNRFFVDAARILAKKGISSLRFDQFGSGNSEGEFIESSYDDWVATAQQIAQSYIDDGYLVALFGQSMGGSTVISVGSKLNNLRAIVSWVPDASIDKPNGSPGQIFEEAGQIVKAGFWWEAHKSKIDRQLSEVKAPMYIVQCSDDEYVSAENHNAIADNAQPNHKVEMFNGYKHSNWTRKQADEIIDESVNFLIKQFMH